MKEFLCSAGVTITIKAESEKEAKIKFEEMLRKFDKYGSTDYQDLTDISDEPHVYCDNCERDIYSDNENDFQIYDEDGFKYVACPVCKNRIRVNEDLIKEWDEIIR